MVFAFPPTGPVIYTGDLRSIREFTRMAPTHHGFAVPYRCGIRMATSGDDVVLLGRNSYHFNRNAELYVELEFLDRRRCMSRLQSYCIDRATFLILRKRGESEGKLLHRWRKLPRTHLRQLVQVDKILDER